MENGGDEWEYVSTSTFDDYSMYRVVNGGDLNEQGYATISVDIPIGDVSGWVTSGTKDLIFQIHGEQMKKNSDAEFSNPNYWPFMAAYGDVYITGESGLGDQDNKILAELNSNVLNSMAVNFKIYDTPSLYLDNGIQTGSRFQTRTNLWKEEDDDEYRSLVEHYIHDRYQLYNKSRRELAGTLHYTGYLKPMSAWIDNYPPDPRKYILSSYTYNVAEDTYNCNWLEYDNNSDVVLTNAGTRPSTLVDPARTRGSRPARGDVTRTSGRRTRPSTTTTSSGTRTSSGTYGTATRISRGG